MYIKPPALRNADKIVRFADYSFNTSIATIKALNDAAAKLNIEHNIIIMMEMGELREGIKREGLIPFYKSVFNLPNINVIGIGTNLGCMMGIKPTYDKLIQLVLYGQLLEANLKQNITLISGASSITLPLLEKDKFHPE
jgi:predicted amino acid racemase